MAYRYVPHYIIEQEKTAEINMLAAQLEHSKFTEDCYNQLSLQYHSLLKQFMSAKQEKEAEHTELKQTYETAECALAEITKQKEIHQSILSQRLAKKADKLSEKRTLEEQLLKNDQTVKCVEREKDILISHNQAHTNEKEDLQQEMHKVKQSILRLEATKVKREISVDNEEKKIQETKKYIEVLKSDERRLKQKLIFYSEENTRLDAHIQERFELEHRLKEQIKDKLEEIAVCQQKISTHNSEIQKLQNLIAYNKRVLNNQKQKNNELELIIADAHIFHKEKISLLTEIETENSRLTVTNATLEKQNHQKYVLLQDLKAHIQNLQQTNAILVEQMKHCRQQDMGVKFMLDEKYYVNPLRQSHDYVNRFKSPNGRLNSPSKMMSPSNKMSQSSTTNKFAESRTTVGGSRIRHQI